MTTRFICLTLALFGLRSQALMAADTLAPIEVGKALESVETLWADYDPRREPLDEEVLKKR